MPGSWTVELDVATAANGSVGGTADFHFGDGTVQIPVTGKYNAKKGESSLKGKGAKGTPGQGLSFAMKGARDVGGRSLTGALRLKVRGASIKTELD